jgi:hypothetical protein
MNGSPSIPTAPVEPEGGFIDTTRGTAMERVPVDVNVENCVRCHRLRHRPNDPTGVQEGAKRCNRRHPCAVIRMTGGRRSVIRVTGDGGDPQR